MSSEQYLTFLSELDDAEADLGSALAACKEPRKAIKDVRKRIKEAGFDLKAFDRAREDAKRPASEREREHQHHQMMMAWLRKPIGTQATIFDAPPQVWSVAELKVVDTEGYQAGLAGDRADANPHVPSNEAWARWHSAWTRAQGEKVVAEIKPAKRGRPRKTPDAETPPAAEAESDVSAAVLE